MARSILIVGSGGREHALAWACSRSGGTTVFCAPGNAGIGQVATLVEVESTDGAALAGFARANAIDLVVIGPDAAVAAGVADALAAAGIPVFGPTARAGRIESSKEFAKALMHRAGIPTARWRACGSTAEGMAFVAELGGRCVVKADGLARGKGVVMCEDEAEAEAALRACFDEGRFGEAGERALVEERLEGPEVGVFAICDGTDAKILGSACDYKRAFDGDRGPNTGGMGSYAPPIGVDLHDLHAEALATTITPCLDALRAAGSPFVGCLYAGLMVTRDGLRVIEYNARFGDPEAQALLPLVAEDLVDTLLAAAEGTLGGGAIAMRPGASVTVVAAADGYPGTPRTGSPIAGLDALEPEVQCFHAGTRAADAGEGVVVAGGRVLTVSAQAGTIEAARDRVYANLDRIAFDGIWYRRDIAHQPAPLRP